VPDERVHVELAFEGGQMLRAVVGSPGVTELEAALARGDGGTLELEAEDGTYVIAVGAVMYLKRFSRETHIGFGASG
jgi:hypothetical protein